MKSPAIEFTSNQFGLLPDWITSALHNYMEFPTMDNWNDVYTYVISTGKIATVWQAVIEIDPTFPDRIPVTAIDSDNVRWPRIPSPDLFRKAIANVVFNTKPKYNLN